MSNKKGSAFILGAMLGTALGAAAAFLYAPQKGEQARKRVVGEGKKLKLRLEKLWQKAQAEAEEALKTAQKGAEKVGAELGLSEQPDTDSKPKQGASPLSKASSKPKTNPPRRYFRGV